MQQNLVDQPGLEATHLIHGFPWDTFRYGTVVDVGGSRDSISILLAQSFPSLHSVVQDRPEVMQRGRADIPAEYKTELPSWSTTSSS